VDDVVSGSDLSEYASPAVPPLAAIEGWALFGERLMPLQIAGFALALGGVMLARSRTPEQTGDALGRTPWGGA
jgi:drug/metabolite transporter (DMT)-like permease